MGHELESSYEWLERLWIVVVDVWKHYRSIIMMTLVCAIVSDVVLSCFYQPLYRSEATFAIKSNNQYATIDQIDEVEEISTAFGYIISSNIFKQKIIDDLKVTSLDGYYETSPLSGTNIIKISAISHEPKIAYQMMNSMLNRYQEISQLVLGNVNIELMQNISIPVQPFNALSHKEHLIMFGSIGFLGSIIFVACMSYFSSTIKCKEDIENLQVPLLGSIPKESKFYISHHRLIKKKSILMTQMSTSFRYVETFKKIRHKIEKHHKQVIMVTSCLENEGKTSVIANIALALKDNHRKVLLMDCDLRKPAIHKIFELENNDGMKEILNGHIDKSYIVHGQQGIDFVLGQTSYEDAFERIESTHLKAFIEWARHEYDYILIDSVPSATFIDTTSLAQLCDGYLLVVRQNYIHQKLFEETVRKLSLSQASFIGCLLNQRIETPLHKGRFYGYYGYEYYHQSKGGDHHGTRS